MLNIKCCALVLKLCYIQCSLCFLGKVKVVRALYAYTAQSADELTFQEGDVLYVTDQLTDTNWWRAKCGQNIGLIPSNYGIANTQITLIPKINQL